MIQVTKVRIHYVNGVVVHKSQRKANRTFANDEGVTAYRAEIKARYDDKKTIRGKKFDHVEILFDIKC